MRRFIITSEKFTGTAELIYNAAGILQKIDATLCDMNEATIAAFKRAVPAEITQLLSGQSFTAGTTVVEADMLISFDQFWTKYDKKINKKRAVQYWLKLNQVDQVAAFYGIDAYNKWLRIEAWRTKLDPENFLKNRTWENEYK